jgi:hypothetical protein
VFLKMQVEKSVFFETFKEIVLSGWLSGINEHPKIATFSLLT